MELKTLNLHKIIQTLYYLSLGKKINYMKLIKLMFFVDRYSLRSYGNPISYDKYFAIYYGPTQTTIKNIVTLEEFFLTQQLENNKDSINFIRQHIKKNEYDVEIINPELQKILPESDMESIEFSLEHFNKFDRFALADITHDYPEWKKFESYFSNDRSGRKDMDYIDFFGNPNIENSRYIKKYLKTDPFYEDKDIMEVMKKEFIFNHPEIYKNKESMYELSEV